jgi:4-O-beta-D-mannosyl-D-glucose phosphorylase
LDYCINTPEDGYRSAASVAKIKQLVAKNNSFLDKKHVFLESL